MEENIIPNDRDYFFDENDDIYQIIGYFHPPNTIYCLKKYIKVPSDLTKEGEFYWHSKVNNAYYSRNILQYSSKSAANNINQNQYKTHSDLFGVDFIAYPKNKIKTYFHPRSKMSQQISLYKSDKINIISKLKRQELILLEVALILEEELNISSEHLGITGSALWDGLHENSDSDLIIYGINNVKKFISNSDKFLNASERIKKLSLPQIYEVAQKFSFKTGLSVDDCVIYTSLKKYLFYYLKTYLSIAFCPTVEEIYSNPLANHLTRFISLDGFDNVTITAEVKNLDWAYFYPALVYIKNIEFKDPKSTKIIEKLGKINIIRILIFEREISGYFNVGNRIEIRGLLQKIINLPEDDLNNNFIRDLQDNQENDSFQLVIGTIENYGNEYIKNFDV